MPKKKEKKPEEDKKPKKKPSPLAPAEDNEKHLYRLQIGFLSDELERQQVKCQRLEREKAALERRWASAETEKKDAVEYLKLELLDKEDEAERLAERLERSLRDERDVLRGRRAEEELRERVRRLEEDNAGLAARLAAAETLDRQRERLMADLAAAEKKLADREDEHAAELKALLEKRGLEEDPEAAPASSAPGAQEPPAASRAAVQEKQQQQDACARYDRLSDKARQLARENQALRQQRGRMAADVAVLEETVRKMARRSCRRRNRVAEQLQAELATRSRDLEQLRSQHAHLQAPGRSLNGQCGRLEAELRDERKRSERPAPAEKLPVLPKAPPPPCVPGDPRRPYKAQPSTALTTLEEKNGFFK